MDWLRRLALAAALACPVAGTAGESMYAASVRGPLNGEAGHAGNLYRVDFSGDVFALVGAIRVEGRVPIGVTGLADHPSTGVLYGITSASSPNHPNALIMVDPANGEAKLIGSLGAAGSDIAFDRNGTLYVWLRETSRLATVDLASGVARPLGEPGPPSETGGLAIDAHGSAYLAATGTNGTLDTVDTRTGTITRGHLLKGTPFPGGINSLTVSPAGVLFAVNTNLGSPANTLLVRIDPASGAVTQVGPLPNETDALVFVETPWTWSELYGSRQSLTLIAAVIMVCIVAAFFLGSRRRG